MSANTAKLNYRLRKMRVDDIAQAYQLTQNLHWPHRQEDWLTMFNVSTAIVMEHEGKVIGTACVVEQGSYASIGLVVIADEYQGYGLGRKIVTAIMQESQCPSFFLSATKAGHPLYEKLGFKEYARIKQYQGYVSCPDNQPLNNDHQTIRVMQSGDYATVLELLNQASGMDREKVFKEILSETQQTIVLERDNTLVGIACYRHFGRGDAIGPVIAINDADAKALLTFLLADNLGKFVRVDTPAVHQLGDELQRWGLSQADDVSAMYAGRQPQSLSSFNAYCLITQALG
ncbi:MAG: GNAT family N-acetyltransferase [Vibrio sp.]